MKKILCILLIIGFVWADEESREKPFKQEVGLTTYIRAEGSALWELPLPNFGIYYRYFVPTVRPVQSFFSIGTDFLLNSNDGNLFTLYADYGIRIKKEGKKWDPMFSAQTAFSFEPVAPSPFEFFELNFVTDLLGFKTQRGNRISFCSPRLNIQYEYFNKGKALWGLSLFNYSVRF